MSKYLPEFARWRNELVFYIGLSVTVVTEVSMALAGADLTSVEAVLGLLPLMTGLAQRQVAYGRETIAEHYQKV